MLPDLSLTK